nr:hypothetical protein [Micromonospora sp. DSM 115978]
GQPRPAGPSRSPDLDATDVAVGGFAAGFGLPEDDPRSGGYLLPVTGEYERGNGNGKRPDAPKLAVIIAAAAAAVIVGTSIALSGVLSSGDNDSPVIEPIANGTSAPPSTTPPPTVTQPVLTPSVTVTSPPTRPQPPSTQPAAEPTPEPEPTVEP